MREVEAALLHPALPVVGTDPVRRAEDRVLRRERCAPAAVSSVTRSMGADDLELLRREASLREARLLVLDDEEPAGAHPVEEARGSR